MNPLANLPHLVFVFLIVQACDLVDCCKCICSALCAVAQACYAPCATASSSSALVYGVPARNAVMEAGHVLLQIEKFRKRRECGHEVYDIVSSQQGQCWLH